MELDYGHYLQIILALIVVLGMMALLHFILKKVNAMQSGIHNKSSRLKIIEERMLDTKNKLIIIRCDAKDYLVILSQNGNTIIDSSITPPKEKITDKPIFNKEIPVESF